MLAACGGGGRCKAGLALAAATNSFRWCCYLPPRSVRLLRDGSLQKILLAPTGSRPANTGLRRCHTTCQQRGTQLILHLELQLGRRLAEFCCSSLINERQASCLKAARHAQTGRQAGHRRALRNRDYHPCAENVSVGPPRARTVPQAIRHALRGMLYGQVSATPAPDRRRFAPRPAQSAREITFPL